jgi:predicted glycogen debranching enzyme
MLRPDQLAAEWLEADGLGGFASATVGGWRTRRYHGLLIPAVQPPSGRALMMAGFDAWVREGGAELPISTQRYGPDVVAPDGYRRLINFRRDPWPTWAYDLGGGRILLQELFLPFERRAAIIRWAIQGDPVGLELRVRPFLAGRDSHALHFQNPDLRPDAAVEGQRVRWQPYGSLPPVVSLANAAYRHDPAWYLNCLLEEERARGFDHLEHLWSPGDLTWSFAGGEAVWLLHAPADDGDSLGAGSATAVYRRLQTAEARRRAEFTTPLGRAADAYIVRRGTGKTIIAGYPWFTDWGRDTFIAMRGLTLASGRLDDARSILLEWAGAVSEGMLPNRFVEAGDAPEFNAVDASLWYIIAVYEFLDELQMARRRLRTTERQTLLTAIEQILTGYSAGTRYGIRAASSGLLEAGAPGVQLTWMDARIGDWVVTPRWGKPVEIQALWLNALRIGAAVSPRWGRMLGRGLTSFRDQFWYDAGGYLADVVDVEGRPGERDLSFRPNQLFAVGGLPFPILEGDLARKVVDAVEHRLWTPLGPRSLAPDHPQYRAHYEGGPLERDGAYHQGTVWPWLAGPFVEAWLRVRGQSEAARAEARDRFLAPLLAHLDDAGLGHVSEIADAEFPHTPRGCPFQAWSVGEVIRLERLLAQPATRVRSERLETVLL